MMGIFDANKLVVPSADQRGIIPRLVEDIFLSIEECDEELEFTIKCSYIEIYLEKIRDLIQPDRDNLKIREAATGGVYIEECSESYVGSKEEIFALLAEGQNSRAIAATKMNAESSRSHSVFILTLRQNNKTTGSKKVSKLFLVDLAGSEKINKTGAEGQTLNEAKYINKSLSALGNVISALTEGNSHVPYRDSKLTRLLQDSLGGNSRTVLIITASPALFNLEETISTLRFGSRAKKIKNTPRINQELSVTEYKQLLATSNRRISDQEELIKALENDLKDLKVQLGRTPRAATSTTATPSISPTPKTTAAQITEEILEKPKDGAKSSTIEHNSDATQLNSLSLSVDSPGSPGENSYLMLQEKISALESQLAQINEQFNKETEKSQEKEQQLDQTLLTNLEQAEKISQLRAKLAAQEAQTSHNSSKLLEFDLLKQKFELFRAEQSLEVEKLTNEKLELATACTKATQELENVKAQAMINAESKQNSEKPDNYRANSPDELTLSLSAFVSSPSHAHSPQQGQSAPSSPNLIPNAARSTVSDPNAVESTWSAVAASRAANLEQLGANSDYSAALERERQLKNANTNLLEDLRRKCEQNIVITELYEDLKLKFNADSSGIGQNSLVHAGSVRKSSTADVAGRVLAKENEILKGQLQQYVADAKFSARLVANRNELVASLERTVREMQEKSTAEQQKLQRTVELQRKQMEEYKQLVDSLRKRLAAEQSVHKAVKIIGGKGKHHNNTNNSAQIDFDTGNLPASPLHLPVSNSASSLSSLSNSISAFFDRITPDLARARSHASQNSVDTGQLDLDEAKVGLAEPKSAGIPASTRFSGSNFGSSTTRRSSGLTSTSPGLIGTAQTGRKPGTAQSATLRPSTSNNNLTLSSPASAKSPVTPQTPVTPATPAQRRASNVAVEISPSPPSANSSQAISVTKTTPKPRLSTSSVANAAANTAAIPTPSNSVVTPSSSSAKRAAMQEKAKKYSTMPKMDAAALAAMNKQHSEDSGGSVLKSFGSKLMKGLMSLGEIPVEQNANHKSNASSNLNSSNNINNRNNSQD
jgi:hypothetical protein